MSQYSQYTEPTVLEYARFHGLARDHRTNPSLQELADVAPQPQLDDYPNLFHIDDTHGKPRIERFSIDGGAAVLLSSVKSDEYDKAASVESILPDIHRVRDMKMDLPLLRTDHELDIQQFGCPVEPDLATEYLPLENVSEEQDEGLEWPSSYENLPLQATMKSTSEKITVSRDTMLYLQDMLNFDLKTDYIQDIEGGMKQGRRKKTVDPLTPPLLPMSPTASSFVPSSDNGHFELVSEATSPTNCDELYRLEEKIMKADVIRRKEPKREASPESSGMRISDCESLGDLFSPLRGIKNLPLSPPHKRVRRGDLKVESPLTPARSEQAPLWKPKNVSFQENLIEIIPDLPPFIEKPENVSSEDIDAFFNEAIRPIAEGANRRIEQEQLQEADTVRRVKVPIMDFSRPVPPWKARLEKKQDSTCDYQRHFVANLKEEHFSHHLWTFSRKAERAMNWVPFPAKLSKVVAPEEITEDESLADFVAQPDKLDCSTLTWKLDGLRLLDHTESDDETIEEGHFPDTADFESLMWNRKTNLKEETKTDIAEAREIDGKSPWRPGKDFISGAQTCDKKPCGEGFSAFNAIGDFMSLRNCQLKNLKTESHYFPSSIAQKEENVILPETTVVVTPALKAIPQDTEVPVPLPILSVATMPRPFIISSTLLANLKLPRRIQQLYPSAELIERDFGLHSNSKTLNPKIATGRGSDTDNSIQSEADILLSPGTGLIWTTLQKIKQRSLPGQKSARSSVKDRILQTAPRYETLLVLVSEGHIRSDGNETLDTQSATTRGLDAKDCEAIAELTGFCSSIEGAQILFISGGETELLTWTVSLMVKYSVSDLGIKLLQEETLWEIFLRRVGMNAFAAQAVLIELKGPELPPSGRTQSDEFPEDFGLVAFVKMSLQERIERFEHLFGGTRLLRKVSRLIDTSW